MEKLEIVKIGDHWVVAYHAENDSEEARSILGIGKSREEAFEMSFHHAAKTAESYYWKMTEAITLLGGDPQVDPLGQIIKRPGTDGSREEDMVDSICLHDGSWHWLYQ